MLLINKNSGTANSINPSKVDKIACGAIKGENPPITSIPRPRTPKENATGKPANRRPNMTPKTITTVIINPLKKY
jgi:hypothetical protein